MKGGNRKRFWNLSRFHVSPQRGIRAAKRKKSSMGRGKGGENRENREK